MAENSSSNQNQEMTIRGVWNLFVMPFLRENGGEFLGRTLEARSPQLAKTVSTVYQLGLSVAAPAKDLLDVGKKTSKDMRGLLEDFSPALTEEYGKSNRAKLMTSKNQIVAHERGRMLGRAKYGVYDTASGLVALAPDLLILVDKKRDALEKEAAAKEKANKQATPADAKGENAPAVESAASPDRTSTAGKAASPDYTDEVKAKLEEKFGRLATSEVFNPKNRSMLEMAARAGSPMLQRYFQSSGKGQYGKTSAYGLIKAVVKQAHSGNGHMDYVMHPKSKDQMPLKDYVLEIFKQHQEDMGESPLNKRFRYMPEMEEACALIADEIKDNLLDPKALVSLVGNRNVLDEHMRVASPETVRAEISKIRRAIEKTENIDPHKFIADTAFETKEEFKEILDSLPAEHKPFFASLFPDAVLHKMGGMKEKEITELRAQGEQEFVTQMTEAIMTLGSLDAQEQQRYGLTAQESKLISGLAKDLDKKGEASLEDLKGQKRVDAVEAVRNARGYWQDLVSGRGARNNPAVREAERLTGNAVDRAGPAEPLSAEEKAKLAEMEERFSEESAPRKPGDGGFASREKAHGGQDGRKYADAVARKGEHSEQRVR